MGFVLRATGNADKCFKVEKAWYEIHIEVLEHDMILKGGNTFMSN